MKIKLQNRVILTDIVSVLFDTSNDTFLFFETCEDQVNIQSDQQT